MTSDTHTHHARTTDERTVDSCREMRFLCNDALRQDIETLAAKHAVEPAAIIRAGLTAFFAMRKAAGAVVK